MNLVVLKGCGCRKNQYRSEHAAAFSLSFGDLSLPCPAGRASIFFSFSFFGRYSIRRYVVTMVVVAEIDNIIFFFWPSLPDSSGGAMSAAGWDALQPRYELHPGSGFSLLSS